MNKEIQSISKTLQDVLNGKPWFGRPAYALLNEIDVSVVHEQPGADSHSLADLLFHMITWAEFTQKRLEKDEEMDMTFFESQDWRNIDPVIHSWEKGMQQFKETHESIIQILDRADDSLLDEIVDYRKYNFRFLLNGLIQHDIYHLGQIAYVKKLLQE